MKDIEKKDEDDVGGGYMPPPDGGGCTDPFPWPPIEEYPREPNAPWIDPFTDPADNRT